MPTLRLTGTPLQADPEPGLSGLLRLSKVSSYALGSARDASSATYTIDAPNDALVKIEYENRLVEWLHVDQFISDVGQQRGTTGEILVPTSIDRGVSRGPAAWVLKALHVFNISPTDALAEEAAAEVVAHFDGKLQTGLYMLSADGSFKARIDGVGQLNSQQPYLVFIHGTASNTQGSFRGFWSSESGLPTPEWKQISQKYGERILALEHATFSLSPAENALYLASLLPDGVTVHLITHSRGGLVGELLGLNVESLGDLGVFADRDDGAKLKDLVNLLQRKQIRVEKFVRVACPASGTVLASKRLDLYLNILLNAIGLIPGVDVSIGFEIFKATALELIKLRADPTKIPGIEAMMPESPFIHFLNTKGRMSKADLGVIAGNYDGSGTWGSLKSYALRAYYWEDNDIIVNTRSMTGGMERSSGVWEYFEQGDNVNHFHYFKNVSTRSRVLQWLSSQAPPSDYQRVRGMPSPQVRGERESAGTVLLLPDVFSTVLNDGNQPIWLNYDALAAGRLLSLADPAVNPGDPLSTYEPLLQGLSDNYDVKPFGYDWRKSISDSAAAVAKKISEEKKSPLHLVGHGMGGLVLLEFVRSNRQIWADLSRQGSKLLLLGTPTRGSWHMARLLLGRGQLVKMLALLGRHPEAKIVELFYGFQGLLDLLPEQLLNAASWQHSQISRPNPANLSQSREWRRELLSAPISSESVFYVAGRADVTPSGLEDYSTAGDGQVTYELGILPSMRTWYDLEHQHGDLPTCVGPIREILTKGTASRLDARPRSTALPLDKSQLLQREDAVLFPDERDLLDAALGRRERMQAKDDLVLRVRVTHGHLREARHPVLVGHYVDDAIVSAEAQLDRQLRGRLSTRFYMETYAGPLGTVEIVQVPGSSPPGALVVGLGAVGELTAESLRRAVLEACLRYALARSEEPDSGPKKTQPGSSNDRRAPRSAAISSVLVGVSAGSFLSVRDSVMAITQGVLDANRTLKHRKLAEEVMVDELEFIELYEGTAVEAIHAVADLHGSSKPNLEGGERLDLITDLQQAPGGRFRRPLDIYATGWWRRIEISQDKCQGFKGQSLILADATDSAKNAVGNTNLRSSDEAEDDSVRLVFSALTDRARIVETLALSQAKLAQALIGESVRRAEYDKNTAVALFELLVPNPFKAQARVTADLVLMLDPVAAQYPWELMSDRTTDRMFGGTEDQKPLALECAMIRQFKTRNSENPNGPRGARLYKALVIGDTVSRLPPLPGAQEEARVVAERLQACGYETEAPLIRKSAREIIGKLFAEDYRILHLAGHGIFTPNVPAKTGMVLDDDLYLSPLEFEQIRTLPELVFINCCYLGKISDDQFRLNTDRPGALAGSVAQTLIQRGVKAVVAAGWAVDDAAARAFALAFYEHLLKGGKFGEAVKLARRAAYYQSKTANTWGAYQCYGNPDFALNVSSGDETARSTVFYSRREGIDELRDILADARGVSADEERALLLERTTNLDGKLPKSWRDGEVLGLLGESYRQLQHYTLASATLQEALDQPKAKARIEAIEQLANCLDRAARKLVGTDPKEAENLWSRAELYLSNLNTVIGENHERLSLLGGLWKRRGLSRKDKNEQKKAFEVSATYYERAYKLQKTRYHEVVSYSGVNWMTMAYLSGVSMGEELKIVSRECVEASRLMGDQPTFWDRTAGPDTLVLMYLLEGSLGRHVEELTQIYLDVFDFGTPNEIDSVVSQLRLIQEMVPNPDLENLLGGISPG